MKFGLLATGFDCSENIDKVLEAWNTLKQDKTFGHELVFSVVYGQFAEYAELFGKQEIKKPEWADKYSDLIDYFTLCEPDSEANHRNLALQPLLDENCDVIWLLDIQDEFYTIKNIKDIISYIQFNSYYCWYSVSLKNYVFDDKTYLLDPFTPPRIFRTLYNGFKLKKFAFDNDPVYIDYQKIDLPGVNYDYDSTRFISYKQFSNLVIPQQTAFVRHESWLNNDRSKSKVSYHHKHFGPGICSFKWNEKENKLEFNELYYRSIGQFIPFLGND